MLCLASIVSAGHDSASVHPFRGAMSVSASTQTQLLQLLASLPKDQNPYVAIAEYIKQQLFPSVPYAATIQLYFLAGALGLTAILVIASLLIRVRKGIFWIVRLQHVPRMVRPHATVSWALIAVIMLGLFEVLIVWEIKFLNKEIQPNFAFWLLLVWGSAWWGGHVAAWSLFSSFLLHLHSTRSTVAVSRLGPLADILGLGTPILYFATIIPIGVFGGLHFRNALNALLEIDGMLDQAAATWKSGDTVSVVALAPALPLAETIMSEAIGFVDYFRATFIFYAATAGILVTYLVTIAAFHLTSLRRMAAQTTRDLSGPNTFVGSNLSPRRRNQQQRRVHRTLRSHAWTIGGISTLGAFFCAVSIMAAINPLALLQSPIQAQVVLLGPLWAFAVFGFPVSVILVRRSMDANAAEERDTDAPSSGAKSGSGGHGGAHAGRHSPFDGGHGGAKNSSFGGSGAGRARELPAEFSIQLNTLNTLATLGSTPDLSAFTPLDEEKAAAASRLEDESDELEIEEEEGQEKRRRWFSRANSEKRRRDEQERYGQSVSVHVQTEVVVDDEEEAASVRGHEKKDSFLHF
ncbi:hypothetical protein JCM8097_007941 [Rhodosporidiobolus ruineniae]